MKKTIWIIFSLLLNQILLSQTTNTLYSTNSKIPLNNEGSIQWYLGKNCGKFIVKSDSQKQNKKKVLSENKADFSGIKISPNPFTEDILVQFAKSAFKISIYNLSGQLIVSKNNINNKQEINFHLGNIPNGIYLMKVTDQQNTKNIKLIKK